MQRWKATRRTVVLCLAWVTLVSVVGCSRQLATPGSAKTGDNGQLPFDRVAESAGISPTAGFASDSIPIGTEITVRLRFALSSADCRAGDTFEALLDDPVVVVGNTVLPRGTPVTGRVFAAKAARGRSDPGYLRLTLASFAMNEEAFFLQTSSIFAKGGAYEKRSQLVTATGSEADNESVAAGAAGNSAAGSELSRDLDQGDVRFSTGHRFTFRLVQPLHLPN